MRVLLAMNAAFFPAVGGADKANVAILKGLAARGHDVAAVVAAGDPEAVDAWRAALLARGISSSVEGDAVSFVDGGVQVKAVVNQAALRAAFLRAVRDLAPDCVVTTTEDPSQMLTDAALAEGARVVFLVHTVAGLPFGPLSFFPGEKRAKRLRHVARFVTFSKFAAGYIQKSADVAVDIVSLPAFGEGPFPDLGRIDNPFVTIVNPSAIKGFSIFAEVVKALPHVAFAAVPTWATTREERAILAAMPNVTLVAPTADFDRILRMSRIVMMPSLWPEQFGMTAVEAMLRGIPVVASDVGGLPEAKLGTGFVLPVRPIKRFSRATDDNMIAVAEVPPQDAAPWIDAVSRLTTDPELYARESESSSRAARAFVSGLTIGPLERILEQVCGGGGGSGILPQSAVAEDGNRKADRLGGLAAIGSLVRAKRA